MFSRRPGADGLLYLLALGAAGAAPAQVIFSRAQPVYHLPFPEGQDALRVPVPVRPGPHMETLAFYFPTVDGTRAELDLHWGSTIVPLSIRVD